MPPDEVIEHKPQDQAQEAGARIERLFSVTVERKANDKEATVYRVSLSSEAPIRDWPWSAPNVLVHEKSAVDLSGVGAAGLPLFVNHRMGDINALVGRIVNVKLDDHRLVGELRFSDANPQAPMIRGMVDEGTLTDMSITAEALKIERTPQDEKAPVRWIRWRPLEGSIVGIGADRSIGINRAATEAALAAVTVSAVATPAIPATTPGERNMEVTPAAVGQPAVITEAPKPSVNAAGLEANRRKGIENLCRANRIDDTIKDLWISGGASLMQVSEELLGILEQRGATNPQPASKLGLTAREVQQFSMSRAILAARENNWSNAGFEAEASRTIAQKLDRTPDPMRFFVPWEVQQRQAPTPIEQLAYSMMKRDLTVASAGAGGYLVETANVGFIELLRNRSVLYNMGARRLSGLQGSVAIPKQSATGSVTWLANEAATISEVNQTFVQVAMSPKNVGGYTEISRQLLLQSNPSAELLVMVDLATIVALAIDLAGLNGSGSAGQPTGILNTSGIGSVTGTTLAYDDIVEFQTDVFAGNALTGNCGFVTTGAVAGLCKQRVKFSSTASPLWEGRLEDGLMDGYRAMASQQIPSQTMLFGDFTQVIIAEWGVLEVEVNPFANFPAGIVGVRAIASIDIGVRYPTAFSAATAIT